MATHNCPLYATIAVLLVSPATVVQAQNSKSSPATILEEVIVTAQRKEESLMETPVAVSAFSAQTLAELGITDTTGLADMVPNLSITTVGGMPNAAGIFIRGLGTLDPQLTADVKVGTYIDGAYLARMNNAVLDLADVQRVEVLRGPQGTLYGRNSTGGAINIISRRPQAELGGSVQAVIGNRGYLRFVGRVDTPEVAGWSGSLNYMTSQHDGFVNNISDLPGAKDKAGADDTQGYRIAAQWNPVDSFTADISYSDVDSKKTPAASQVTTYLPFFPQFAPNASEERLGSVAIDGLREDDSENQYRHISLSWQLGNVTLKSITAYSEWDRSGGNDPDGGEYFSATGERAAFNRTSQIEGQEQWTQEFQLQGSALNEQADYILGAFFFSEEGDASSGAFSGVIEDAIPTLRTSATDYSSQALFGQATWRPASLDSKLALTAGARYTEDDKEASQIIEFTNNATGLRDRIELAGEDDWSNFSWTAVVDYQWTDSVMSYIKASTGYNAGGFNIRDTGIDPDTGAADFETPFDEETLITYELGLKAEMLGQRLRINAAIFKTEFDDMQLIVIPPRNECLGGLFCSRTLNAGQAELEGLELEVEAILLAGLSLQASYAYIDAEVTEFLDQNGVDRSATSAFAMTPEHSGNINLSYQFPTTGIGTLALRVGASYRDDVFFVGSTETEAYAGNDYTLFNARLTLSEIPVTTGDLRLSLWGKNLDDEEYRTMGIDRGRYTENNYAQLRSYGVDISYEF